MLELSAKKREKLGKGVRSLRSAGLIPAELYGHGVVNLHLAVPAKAFEKIYKGTGASTLIQLEIEGDKRPALIHDIQRDSVGDEVTHIDFYQVKMNEKITARVPVEFLGEAPVAKAGGILNKTMTEIEVEALPADLPSHFEVDLGVLKELDQSIYIKDIKVPDGVKVLVDTETVMVSVTPPRVEEVKAAPVVDVSEVKVETEEKKAEREKETVVKGKEEPPTH